VAYATTVVFFKAEEYYNITPNEGTHTHTHTHDKDNHRGGVVRSKRRINVYNNIVEIPATDRARVSRTTGSVFLPRRRRYITRFIMFGILYVRIFLIFFCGQRREVHAKKFSWYAAVVLPFYFYDPCVSKTVVVFVVWCWSSSPPCLL